MSLSSEELENLSDLLLSVNDTNTEIAFEILSGQEIFPKGLLTEVFVVYKLTDSDVLKEKARIFLEHYGIDKTSSIIKAKAHLKTAKGATEKRINTNIATYVRASQGKLDGVKMATAMYNKYGVGLHYLLDNAGQKQQHEILETFMSGSSFKMTNVSLLKIPESLYDFENLTEIDLSQNDLVTLPLDIKVFKKLQRLNISDNKIKKLPKSITTLEKLTHLNLSENRISEFPAEISKMPQLTHLNVERLDTYNNSNSDYLNIPEEFSKLKNIQELVISSYNTYSGNLSTNYINYPSISKLSSDTPLDLNPLTLAENAYLSNGKHDGVSYLFKHSKKTKLKHKIITEQFYDSAQKALDFKEIKIDKFPDQLGDFDVKNIDCSKMNLGLCKTVSSSNTFQYINDEELEKLYEELAILKNIEEANFEGNNLKVVPLSLLTWKKLKKLDLSRNRLGQEINLIIEDDQVCIGDPSFLVNLDLSNWSGLEELNLSSNKIIELPESFEALKKLKTLNLEHNSITNLSSNLKYLHSLEELKLKGNYIESLPNELIELSHLKKLQIDLSEIELLEPLCKLINLENLAIEMVTYNDISTTECEYIVKKLAQLPKLKTLKFFDTQIDYYSDNSKKLVKLYENAFEEYFPDSCELKMENY